MFTSHSVSFPLKQQSNFSFSLALRMQEDAQAGNSGIIKVGSAPKVLAMDPSAALARWVSAEPASDPKRWPFSPTKVLYPWLVSCGHDRAGLHLCRLALVSFVTGCGRICHVSLLFASVFISFTFSLSFAGFSHQTHNHTLFDMQEANPSRSGIPRLPYPPSPLLA